VERKDKNRRNWPYPLQANSVFFQTREAQATDGDGVSSMMQQAASKPIFPAHAHDMETKRHNPNDMFHETAKENEEDMCPTL
jgi:hypothetical protein